jgi:hypothetical protein
MVSSVKDLDILFLIDVIQFEHSGQKSSCELEFSLLEMETLK